jgi:transposase
MIRIDAIWLTARRLHQGRFTWPASATGVSWTLSPAQLDALVLGLPWCERLSFSV